MMQLFYSLTRPIRRIKAYLTCKSPMQFYWGTVASKPLLKAWKQSGDRVKQNLGVN